MINFKDDEITMIHEYILLPYIITMVERARDDIEHSLNPLRDLISRYLIVLQDSVQSDLAEIKKYFRRNGIKVWEDEQRDMVIYHKLAVRGYENRIGIIKEVMKSRIRMKLTEYGKQILRSDQHAPSNEAQQKEQNETANERRV